MMLAYAANRPAAGRRQSSPNALLLVISAHVALVAVVMSAKMDLPRRILEPPITTLDFPRSVDPPPQPRSPIVHPAPTPVPEPPIPIPPPPNGQGPATENGPAGPATGLGSDAGPTRDPGPSNPIRLAPVRHGPQLLTPFSQLRPPYPASKLASEEEAVLTLRLTIDSEGRVIAVEPVGSADRVFVDAARRYMVAHWRYSPATEDGRAIGSSLTVTLRFMLDA